MGCGDVLNSEGSQFKPIWDSAPSDLRVKNLILQNDEHQSCESGYPLLDSGTKLATRQTVKERSNVN